MQQSGDDIPINQILLHHTLSFIANIMHSQFGIRHSVFSLDRHLNPISSTKPMPTLATPIFSATIRQTSLPISLVLCNRHIHRKCECFMRMIYHFHQIHHLVALHLVALHLIRHPFNEHPIGRPPIQISLVQIHQQSFGIIQYCQLDICTTLLPKLFNLMLILSTSFANRRNHM